MPSEPEDSKFKSRIKQKAYPCVERGGVIWTYMGPPELKPELPELEWAMLGDGHRFVSKRLQETNYLQAMEGGIDSSHVSFAHRFNLDDDPMHSGTEGNKYLKADTRPKFEVAESDGGLVIGARRNANDDEYYWRITQWIMPWYTIIPPFGTHNPLGGHAWVPIDDETCWAWSINYHPTRELREDELASMRNGDGIHAKYIPGTYRTLANKDNDYLMDREAQKQKKTFSGIEASPPRTSPCRNRWEQSAIAPRNASELPTPASSWPAADCSPPSRNSKRKPCPVCSPNTSVCGQPRSCCRRQRPSRKVQRTHSAWSKAKTSSPSDHSGNKKQGIRRDQ